MTYLIGLLILYFGVAVSAVTPYRGKLFHLISLLALGSIAIFRGNVGTDTLAYEHIVSAIRLSELGHSIEPGFFILSKAIARPLISDQLAVRILAVIFTLLLAIFLAKEGKNGTYFLATLLLPAFFYTYSMNVLRIGLASALILAMTQLALRAKKKSALSVGLLSISMHYSSLTAITIILITNINHHRIFRTKKTILLSCSVLFIAIAAYFAQDHISSKLDLYSSTESPTAFSGASKLIFIATILIGVFFSNLEKKARLRIFFVGSLLSAFSMTLATHSYAGLRLLDLLSFSLPLSIYISHQNQNLRFSSTIKVSFFLAGLLGAFFNYRNFLSEEGIGPSPFLPYHTLISTAF